MARNATDLQSKLRQVISKNLIGRLLLTLGLCAPALTAAGDPSHTDPRQAPPKPSGFTILSLDSLGESDSVSSPSEDDRSSNDPADSSGFELLDVTAPNLRFTIDLSTRAIFNAATNETATENFIGFDIHKVLSNASGDWGTLVLQGYLTRIDNQPMRAGFFEDDDDWEFVYRIFNFNYTGLSRGLFNIRVGHFEVPFGLEQTINTNGTLRQFSSPENLGIVADWGVSINGNVKATEYEVSLTRGTGNEWTNRGEPFIVAGRVGTKLDHDLAAGVSGFYGDVSTPALPADTVRRLRVGADAIYDLGPFTLLGEFSVGQDDGDDVVNALVELDWRNPDESVLLYVQCRSLNREVNGSFDHANSVTLGCRYTPDNHWAFSVQWTQNLETFSGQRRNSLFAVQARYRF